LSAAQRWHGKNQNMSAESWITTVGTAFGVMVSVATLLTYRHNREKARDEAPDDRHRLMAAAAQLADVVGTQWREEEKLRRINDPFPLPVRWINAPENMFDHWSNICLS